MTKPAQSEFLFILFVSMNSPSGVAARLRQIAYKIDRSIKLDRSHVVHELRSILAAIGPFLQIFCPRCQESLTVKETVCPCGEEVWFDQAGQTLPADLTCHWCGETFTVKTVPCPQCGEEIYG